MRINGVGNKADGRQLYFQRTFFDIAAATLHGVAACEIMTEFALFEAIRLSEGISCVHYIRFLSADYEEINAMALGNWPSENALIICSWLEKDGNLVWKRNLSRTRFANYPEDKIKIIVKISGNEMDEWRSVLNTIDFCRNTDEKQMIRANIEKLSQVYQEVFKKFFSDNIIEDHSAMTLRMSNR